MDKRDFLKKGLMGSGIFVANAAFGNLIKNEIDELKDLEVLGFNHLPNTNSSIMSNSVLHKANSRGHANHGWLQSYHTFSFASYYNPERMHFGVLRVLNDDTVAGGMGFNTHPHDNMEIISIPLEGDLEHKDNMGNIAVIRNGDIQVMSAGTGIQHSEFNKNKDRLTKFLQIWVFPNKRNVKPRYDQISLKTSDRKNKLQLIVSPNPGDPGVWIHQDAWFHLGSFDSGIAKDYQLKKSGNGIYIFLLNGKIVVDKQELSSRDGYGIWDVDKININAKAKSEFLIMEVPMSI